MARIRSGKTTWGMALCAGFLLIYHIGQAQNTLAEGKMLVDGHEVIFLGQARNETLTKLQTLTAKRKRSSANFWYSQQNGYIPAEWPSFIVGFDSMYTAIEPGPLPVFNTFFTDQKLSSYSINRLKKYAPRVLRSIELNGITLFNIKPDQLSTLSSSPWHVHDWSGNGVRITGHINYEMGLGLGFKGKKLMIVEVFEPFVP